MDREKTFLLRAAEDLDKSLTLTKETISVLEVQIDALEASGLGKRADERRELLDWYQKYAGWLKGMAEEFDADLADHFSHQQAGAGWTSRYEQMMKGYQTLAGQLAAKMQKLDDEKRKVEARTQKLNKAVLDRRILVEKDDLAMAKDVLPAYKDRPFDQREAVYKDLTDDEVESLRREMRRLGEQQLSISAPMELEQYELIWLSLRAEESEKLSAVARAVGSDAPGPLRESCRDMVRTYESDIASLQRRSDEIDGKLRGMTRSGTLNALDRFDELSQYYEKMKSRFASHTEWLRAQINGYQADLVELAREQ